MTRVTSPRPSPEPASTILPWIGIHGRMGYDPSVKRSVSPPTATRGGVVRWWAAVELLELVRG
jgi:hypothetical protein